MSRKENPVSQAHAFYASKLAADVGGQGVSHALWLYQSVMGPRLHVATSREIPELMGMLSAAGAVLTSLKGEAARYARPAAESFFSGVLETLQASGTGLSVTERARLFGVVVKQNPACLEDVGRVGASLAFEMAANGGRGPRHAVTFLHKLAATCAGFKKVPVSLMFNSQAFCAIAGPDGLRGALVFPGDKAIHVLTNGGVNSPLDRAEDVNTVQENRWVAFLREETPERTALPTFTQAVQKARKYRWLGHG